MLSKITKILVSAGLVASAGLAAASEPIVLTDENMDAISAGYTFALSPVPTSAAFAYAYTSATSSPYFRVTINAGYTGNVGAGQAVNTWFDSSINWSAF